jgi:hypothetical protein
MTLSPTLCFWQEASTVIAFDSLVLTVQMEASGIYTVNLL